MEIEPRQTPLRMAMKLVAEFGTMAAAQALFLSGECGRFGDQAAAAFWLEVAHEAMAIHVAAERIARH